MKQLKLHDALIDAMLAVAIIASARWGIWPAGLVVLGVSEMFRRSSIKRLTTIPYLIPQISLLMLAAASVVTITQMLCLVLLIVWRIFGRLAENEQARTLAFGFSQISVLIAIFTIAAIWRLPSIVSLAIVWLTAYALSIDFLRYRDDSSADVLALAWALMATQLSWIFTLWAVMYVLPGNIFVIPQAAVVISGIGYCCLSIYLAHNRSRLSRARLAEYLIIGLSILMIVIAGTKWNGSV
jgi:hypothetical protein